MMLRGAMYERFITAWGLGGSIVLRGPMYSPLINYPRVAARRIKRLKQGVVETIDEIEVYCRERQNKPPFAGTSLIRLTFWFHTARPTRSPWPWWRVDLRGRSDPSARPPSISAKNELYLRAVNLFASCKCNNVDNIWYILCICKLFARKSWKCLANV